MAKKSPFDYITAISQTKERLDLEDDFDKAYLPFIVNRGLSYFSDTVILANEMNMKHLLPKKMQFAFLINSVRSKKRFSKWAKKTNDELLTMVKEYYGYSDVKASEAMKVLTKEQLEEIKTKMSTGGKP